MIVLRDVAKLFLRQKKWSRFLLIVAALAFVGCAGVLKRPMIDPAETNWRVVKNVVERNYHKLKTLKGQGRLIVETPQQSYNATSTVVIKKPDSVFIKVEAAFGIDIGWMFTDRNSYIIYTPYQNLYYTGPVDSLNLRNFLSFDLTFEKLLQTLTGMVLIEDIPDLRLTRDNNKLLLTGNQGKLRYWVDPMQGVVTRVEKRDERNRLLQLEEYQRYTVIKNVHIPRTIRIQRPRQREALTLFYTRLEVNKKVSAKDFKIKIPESALRIYL